MIDNRTEKRKTGDWGEDLACRYLLEHGYEIIARNFLCKIGEIDIIAMNEKHILSIVEVKTRNTYERGYPCEFVNSKKQRLVKLSYEYFILINPMFRDYQVSFDIIELLFLEKGKYIRHLINAF